MSFGERIKKRREELSLTQEDVGAFIDEELTRQAISKWENGAGFPEVERLLALSVKLDISLDEMFADELNYLKRKIKGDDTFSDKYPGIMTGLKLLAEHLKSMDL